MASRSPQFGLVVLFGLLLLVSRPPSPADVVRLPTDARQSNHPTPTTPAGPTLPRPHLEQGAPLPEALLNNYSCWPVLGIRPNVLCFAVLPPLVTPGRLPFAFLGRFAPRPPLRANRTLQILFCVWRD